MGGHRSFAVIPEIEVIAYLKFEAFVTYYDDGTCHERCWSLLVCGQHSSRKDSIL